MKGDLSAVMRALRYKTVLFLFFMTEQQCKLRRRLQLREHKIRVVFYLVEHRVMAFSVGMSSE